MNLKNVYCFSHDKIIRLKKHNKICIRPIVWNFGYQITKILEGDYKIFLPFFKHALIFSWHLVLLHQICSGDIVKPYDDANQSGSGSTMRIINTIGFFELILKGQRQ